MFKHVNNTNFSKVEGLQSISTKDLVLEGTVSVELRDKDEWARSREIWQKYDYQTIMHSGGPYSQITFTTPLLEEDRDELLALGWQIREFRASKYIPWNTLWSQVGFTNITLGNNDTK